MRKLIHVTLVFALIASFCLPAGISAFADQEVENSTVVSQTENGSAPDSEESSTHEENPDAEKAAIVALDDDPAEEEEVKADSEMDSVNEDGNAVDSGDDAASPEDEDADTEKRTRSTKSKSSGLALLDAGDEGAVYVNGKSGNDDNAGTKDAPVKSFSKAKELMQANGADAIYVTGAITLSGTSEAWDLDGKSLVRDVDYHGDLVIVQSGASLTLTNIVVDGAKDSGATGIVTRGEGSGGSLVYVIGSTLNLEQGAVLQNNDIEIRGHWYPEAGGAVFAEKDSTIEIDGAEILNNAAVYGGGLYASEGTVVNMKSGTIANNTAKQGTSTDLTRGYGGSGGGICVAYAAKMTFSGGVIKNNSAYERGGGISLGTFYAMSPKGLTEFTMTGGIITGNSAGSAGGGLFVQYGYSDYNGQIPSYSVAYIHAGDITNNVMTKGGQSNSMFGGGGMYVNGINTQRNPRWHNGEVYTSRVNVSSNTARIQGGGYAGCPVSDTDIELTNGAVFFNNASEQNTANEIYILSSWSLIEHSGNPSYDISPSMLGGGPYAWKYDNGEEVPLSSLHGVLRGFLGSQASISLNNDLTAEDRDVQKALSMSEVNITGNTSQTRGGGIGTNGSVFIGAVPETVEIDVTKKWDDADNKDEARPDRIMVELYRDGVYVGFQYIRISRDETSTTFTNLPKSDGEGHEYVYTVKERSIDGYASAVEGNMKDGFTVTNTRDVSVSAQKVWDDSDDADGLRPDSVTFALMRGDEEIDSATAGAAEDWMVKFEGLPKYDADGVAIEYSIVEKDVPAGYESSSEGDMNDGFTITNTHVPEYISVSVTKYWVGTVAGGVTVRLLADDEDTGVSLVLNDENEWTGSFDDLPTIRNGKEVVYTVSEDEVEGYLVDITGSAAEGFVITNTKQEVKGEDREEPDEPKESEEDDDSDKPKPKGDEPDEDEEVVTVSSPHTGDDSFALLLGSSALAGSLIVLLVCHRVRKRQR